MFRLLWGQGSDDGLVGRGRSVQRSGGQGHDDHKRLQLGIADTMRYLKAEGEDIEQTDGKVAIESILLRS